MLILVEIDLSDADVALFETYEDKALALLERYNASLQMRVRSVDQLTETHVLYFDNRECFEAFLADPSRAAMKTQWEACKAISKVSEVTEIG